MLNDAKARADAINPKLSAIVQAPAGSGKTELLTQRFLNLLCTVDAPEQVVALTFTRKAAHEMQARILSKLKTHEEALARDKALDWQLFKNPSRLRVTTLDSLCQSLTQAMPLQDKHVPYASVTDTPSTLYWKAARATIKHAISSPDYQEAITILLTHLDNRRDILLALLTEQLAKRDQWLAPIYQARLQDRTHLEAALKHIEQHAIHQFQEALPTELSTPLIQLAAEVATLDSNPHSPRAALKTWQTHNDFDSEQAAALASLLLTTQKKLRKSFDHHVGLKRDSCPAERYKTLKADSKVLLEDLNNTPGFLDALLRVRALPKPHYPDAEWEPLQALLTLLPLLAGHLHLVFQAAQATDFSGVTHQALDALGFEDTPTDLALYLDYNIQHLLVDEFQDTSIQQFELIARLTRGFEPGDGRTLFVVGDPMQSIYRFRAAEVGLFLRAQLHGIGDIKLTPLYLNANFRSNAPLVEWINQYFTHIFPPVDDLESGAVSFHASIPEKPANQTIIKALTYADAAAEAHAIADLSQQLLQHHPDDTTAILVRSRRQLPVITQALDAQNIQYQGLDTDLTASLTHIKDIWSLIKALLMPTHRLAWLSLLRSPWCGLSLSDLHQIANHAPKASILSALADSNCINQLTETGQKRVTFVFTILNQAIKTRYQEPLVIWVLNTLKALHLDAILSSAECLDLTSFWDKITQFEQDGMLSEITLLEQELTQLYTKKAQSAPIQIMTIHKAKGLEFDTVILPGLGRRAPAPDKPLLRWLTLPSDSTENAEDLILISPLNAAHEKHAVLYDYLGELDAEKNKYEQQRLLYVAATRAKKRLYLLDSSETITQHTFRDNLKAYPFETMSTNHTHSTQLATHPKHSYLPDAFYLPYKLPTPDKSTNPPSTLPDLTPARLLGTITHALLEWICTYHPEAIEDIPWHLSTPALKALGLTPAEYQLAETQIKTWITALFNHPRGHWIIQEHRQENSEYALLVFENNRVNTRVIDRLFEYNGIYWIIDFKTGEQNTQHYQIQLNRYASYMTEHTALPIRCGLYYLEDAHWVEWAFEAQDLKSPLSLLPES
jgi:ATP-dependent exoDNAse (exonuclease V) beta subunit